MFNVDAVLSMNAGITGIIHAAGRLGPAKRAVVRELHRILRTDPVLNGPPPIRWRFLDRSHNLLGALHDPWLLALVVAIVIALYFLIRATNPYIQNGAMADPQKQSARKDKKHPLQYYMQLYLQALEESKANLYREAVISLHKSTVEYLLAKAIVTISNKKYTNNDLKRMLRNNGLSQPFRMIAGQAEIAGFSTAQMGVDEFKRVLDVFEQSFLSLIQREE